MTTARQGDASRRRQPLAIRTGASCTSSRATWLASGASRVDAWYWVQTGDNLGRKAHLVLVAIDELGAITTTGVRQRFDEAAATRGDAVVEHLAEAVKEADANLERRRARLGEQPDEPKPPPVDPATRRFFSD